MSSFEWKKNIEGSVEDGLVITVATMRVIYLIKELKLNILLAIEQKSGIWTGVSPKDHIVYKNGSTSEWFPRDLAWSIMQSFITC